MANPMIRIHNTETDVIIDREMNAAEFAQYEIERVDYLAAKTTRDATAAAKASGVAKLAALGFTEAEIAAW